MTKKLNHPRVRTQDGLTTTFLTLLRLASWLGYLPITVKKTSSQRIIFNMSQRMKWFNGVVIVLLAAGRALSFYDDIVTGSVPDSMVTVMLRLSELMAMGMFLFAIQLTSYRRVICLQKFVHAIKRIDASLADNSVHGKEQFRVWYLFTAMSFTFPILSWDLWRQTLNVHDTSSKLNVIRNYAPFFVAVTMLILFQTTVTFFFFMVDIRMVTLYNIAKILHKDVFQDQTPVGIETIDDIVSARRANKNIDYLRDTSSHASANQGLVDKVRQVVEMQAEIRSLCEELNNCYDALVVIFLLLSVIQLNMSPFFLIIDSSSTKAGENISLQVVWVLMHTHWIAVHVEACNSIAKTDRELSSLLGDLLAELSLESGGGLLRERELQALWRANELTAVTPLLFEPLDLATVDRSLYSSIARTITTYLVILIQLHKTYS